VEIADENTHRLLAYIDALNRQGIKPGFDLVDAFGDQSSRAHRRSNSLAEAVMPSIAKFSSFTVWTEDPSEYLERLGWIDVVDREVELNRVGRAMLRALNTPQLDFEASPTAEIVLGTDDPFAYAQVVQVLGGAGPAMLVEPYLRVQNLIDIDDLHNINRILVGSKLKANEYAALAVGLGAVNERRPLEIRKATDLHDRYLIPDTGHVLMLGISLGGIGKKVSTLTTLGDPASGGLRQVFEEAWAAAEPINPTGAGQSLPVSGGLSAEVVVDTPDTSDEGKGA
jgi:hypothetical protein